MPKYFKLYLVWTVVVILLVFAKDKFSPDNITHFLILAYLGAGLWLFKKFGQDTSVNFKRNFLLYCISSASVVEGFYMITSPVFSSLRFTAGMTVAVMLKNYIIDLIFTIPAYYLIFRVVWHLINKYQYNLWQYIILFSFGQALGDGSRAFLTNPGLLIFIPYVLINYNAMNVAPYLRIQDRLPANRSNSIFKFVAPILLLPLTYLICALGIYSVGAVFKLK